jgi:DNA-binding LytR/AlgR family response regulator
MAVNKLNRNDSNVGQRSVSFPSDREHLFFNVSKKLVKVYLDEILYIESLREYIRITTSEKNILTKMQLGEIEEMLPKNSFIRVHRSFIVSKPRIDAFSPAKIEINGKTLPIGRNYKDLVLSNMAK